jgi:hypothetical protein
MRKVSSFKRAAAAVAVATLVGALSVGAGGVVSAKDTGWGSRSVGTGEVVSAKDTGWGSRSLKPTKDSGWGTV